MKRCAVAKQTSTSAVAEAPRPEGRGESRGSPAGVPLFLRAQSSRAAPAFGGAAAAARNGGPPVQDKCACGGSGATCAACADEAPEDQSQTLD